MPVGMNNANDEDFEPTADVGAQRIARTYAEALLNASDKQGQSEQVLEALESLIGDLFPKEPQLEAFLSSSAVGRDRRARVIDKVFENKAGNLFVDFLKVLNQHERLDLLRPILIAAKKISDERAKRIRVQVRSAVPLANDQENRLRQQLRDALKLEPVLKTEVDPELLGGVVVRVGDWLYDASVRAKLDSIRNQLIARSSHEIQSGRDRFSIASGN
jgi:F-type H+-transporting ATPase subunit delta